MQAADVVITGVGVASPIGIGKAAFWEALLAGRCGLGPAPADTVSGLPPQLFGQVPGFEAKTFVANRKSIKVMSRDAQLGVAASVLACRDAGIAGHVDPERLGVVLGADQICAPIAESQESYRACCVDGRFDFGRWVSHGMPASYPLGMLRVLPNMVASHVSIAHDARGPNNTIHEGEVSSLLAIIESASVHRARHGRRDVGRRRELANAPARVHATIRDGQPHVASRGPVGSRSSVRCPTRRPCLERRGGRRAPGKPPPRRAPRRADSGQAQGLGSGVRAGRFQSPPTHYVGAPRQRAAAGNRSSDGTRGCL